MPMKNTEPAAESIKTIQVSQQHYSGPLPRPEDLAKYDQIVPGAAERIIKMAEKEMQHRHATEDKLSKGMTITTYLSIVFAFISVLILCAIVVYALYLGFSTVAASIAVGSIAAVAGVFIYKTKRKKTSQ